MRKLLCAFFGAASVLAVSGCAAVVEEKDVGAADTNVIIDATGANQTVAYSQDLIELSVQTPSLTLTGLPAGKSVYLLKTNPSALGIAADQTRYVSKMTGMEAAESHAVLGQAAARAAAEEVDEGNCDTMQLNAELDELYASSRAAADTAAGKGPVDYKIGDTKTLWVDKNYSAALFEKRTATLRAEGKTCYVWVVENGQADFWTREKACGAQVDGETVRQIAQTFDTVYGMVRNVFGEESDELILNGNTRSFGGMESYSDTGTKVNIVMYDINGDGDFGTTVGYFYAKDYVTNYNSGCYAYSNGGKYFYLDVYYVAHRRGLAISTLAHEFQHMIDWGRKTMEGYKVGKKIRTSAAQNEMMSMLCEDIMKQYFKDTFPGFQEKDTPMQRLSVFCRHYYDIGLEYDGSSARNVSYSYANNYAFGAWLIRNYGGVELLSRMSKSEYVNVECIEKATGVAIDEMLREYAQACTVDSEEFGFNKAVESCPASMVYTDGRITYDYPIGAIDLWELHHALALNTAVSINDLHSFVGPVCFDAETQQELRPYGIMLSKLGEVSAAADSVTLAFNTTGLNAAQKTYILIK